MQKATSYNIPQQSTALRHSPEQYSQLNLPHVSILDPHALTNVLPWYTPSSHTYP